MKSLSSLAAALFLLAPRSTAQSLEAVLETGEPFPGFGVTIASIWNAELDDSRSWFAHVDLLAQRDPAPPIPGCLVTEGSVLGFGFAPGQIDASPGGDLASIRQIWTPSGFAHALFWNDRAFVHERDPATAAGLPAGSVHLGFDDLHIDGQNRVLAPVRLSSGPALLRYQLDAAGDLIGSEVLLFQDPAPSASVHTTALNERGHWMAAVSTAALPAGSILINGTAVARAGDPAPLAGRTYAALADSPVDLDDHGHFAFVAGIDGGGSILVRDGALVAASGEVLPSLAPHVLGDLLPHRADPRARRVCLSNSGDVYWYADVVDGPDALMRNREVLVRAGATMVEGRVVSSVGPALSISPTGRFWCAIVGLSSQKGALVVADLGLTEPIRGCGSNPASLALADGPVLAGQTISLELDGTPAVGASSYLYFGLGSAIDSMGCGRRFPFGEVLLDLGTPTFFRQGPSYAGAPVAIALSIPNALALVDLELFAQGFFFDASVAPAAVQLTNGLRLEIGAP